MAKKQVTNPQLRADIRKFGIKEMRAQRHPQQYRVKRIVGARKKLIGAGATLGPTGELGDEIIFQISMFPGYNIIKNLFPDLSEANIWKMIKDNIYLPLFRHLDKKIDRWVPAMSGDLSNAIRKSLTKDSSIITKEQFLQQNIFEVVLNTKGIEYAKPVNKMPKSYIKHPAPHHPNRRNGYPLYDPDAEPGSFNLLVLEGRNFAKPLFINFMRNNLVPAINKSVAGLNKLKQMLGISINTNAYNIAQSLIKIRYK